MTLADLRTRHTLSMPFTEEAVEALADRFHQLPLWCRENAARRHQLPFLEAQRLHSFTHFLFCATADARTSCRALIAAQLRLAFQLMRAAEDTQPGVTCSN